VAADHGLHAVVFVVLGLVQLFAGQLAVDDGVGAANVARHVAVGDAAHLKRVQAAEVGDLLKRERGVVHQPDRGGLGHQDVGHGHGSRRLRPEKRAFESTAPDLFGRAREGLYR